MNERWGGEAKEGTTKKKNSPAPQVPSYAYQIRTVFTSNAFQTHCQTRDNAPKLSKPTAFLLKHHHLHHRHVFNFGMIKNDDDVVPYLPHSSSRTLFIDKQHKKTPLSNCNVLNNECKSVAHNQAVVQTTGRPVP